MFRHAHFDLHKGSLHALDVAVDIDKATAEADKVRIVLIDHLQQSVLKHA